MKQGKRKIHLLKIREEYADAVFAGEKKFEVRKNDRNFNVGDLVGFIVFENRRHPLDGTFWEITYILPGGAFGIDPDYVVMSIEPTQYVAEIHTYVAEIHTYVAEINT